MRTTLPHRLSSLPTPTPRATVPQSVPLFPPSVGKSQCSLPDARPEIGRHLKHKATLVGEPRTRCNSFCSRTWKRGREWNGKFNGDCWWCRGLGEKRGWDATVAGCIMQRPELR
ncbi:hypothetical protein LIA77_00729 [Sarocladium implicatum]|nr:hypothetical protein LIA77_00729 [Sarocladium implicatum]